MSEGATFLETVEMLLAQKQGRMTDIKWLETLDQPLLVCRGCCRRLPGSVLGSLGAGRVCALFSSGAFEQIDEFGCRKLLCVHSLHFVARDCSRLGETRATRLGPSQLSKAQKHADICLFNCIAPSDLNLSLLKLPVCVQANTPTLPE